MEPRARASRHKTSLNFGPDLEGMLVAFGAPANPYLTRPIPGQKQPSSRSEAESLEKPYSETLRVLDEIVTDFVIETCHVAVQIAAYSGRAKLKLQDFEFALRRDGMKLGHTATMLQKKRDIDNKRKAFEAGEVGRDDKAGYGGRIAVGDLETLAEGAGEEGTGKGKGRGRGRRKKRKLKTEDAEEQVDGMAIGDDEDIDGDEMSEGGRPIKRAKSIKSEA